MTRSGIVVSLLIRCHRCRRPLVETDFFCPICGAKSPHVQIDPEGMRHFPLFIGDLKRRIEASIVNLRYRYGTLPVASLLGLLPLIPLSSLIGTSAGILGLIRIVQGRSPTEGIPLALLGIVGAVIWFILGLFAIGQFGEMLNLILHEILNVLGLIFQEIDQPGFRSA